MSNAKRRHRSRYRMNRTRSKFGAAPGDTLRLDSGPVNVTRVEEDWGLGRCTIHYVCTNGTRSHFHSTPKWVALLRETERSLCSSRRIA